MQVPRPTWMSIIPSLCTVSLTQPYGFSFVIILPHRMKFLEPIPSPIHDSCQLISPSRSSSLIVKHLPRRPQAHPEVLSHHSLSTRWPSFGQNFQPASRIRPHPAQRGFT